MIIVLKKDIPLLEKNDLRRFLEASKLKVNEVTGTDDTVFAAVGKVSIDPREVEILPGVDRVIPISKPYKMASREFKRENTIVSVPNNRGQIIKVGGLRVVAIAGPCAVENKDQMMDIARSISKSGAVMLRGGAYKPRTSPYSFQGLAEEGLILLKNAGDAYGMPVVTECVATEHIPVMEKHGVDVYQIGARNMQNFELLKKVGALKKPVILKRGISATIEEWLMAAEYLLSSGTDNVILCERGIRTYEKATRNTLDLSAIPILRPLTHLPIIVDPSHAIGIRDKIAPMGLAAIASGADGIIVEVHNNPSVALSDGPQSLFPEQFDKLMRDIDVLAPVVGKETTRIRTEKIVVDSSVNNTQKNELQRKCAYSGSRGAYAEQAIMHFFENEVETVSCKNFREVFQAVLDGKTDYGMIPIENCLAGSVYENYDNLLRFEDVSIVGSIKLRIEHSLLGIKGTTIDSIKAVYSHPQGFSQCGNFLNDKNWNQIECPSTSFAAKSVEEKNSTECAAIASSYAAIPSHLEVIRTGIEDDPRNYTRFIIIASTNTINASGKTGDEIIELENGKKGQLSTSVVFNVKNEPGALLECLSVFRKYNLNMTRLESRPIPGQPWKYLFYADSTIEKKETMKDFLDELGNTAENVKLLGIYREIL